MSAAVYVVTGTTGEYSDRSLWIVRVFDGEAEALAFVEMANGWLRGRGLFNDDTDSASWDYERPHFDPCLSVSYTGARYHVEAVPFGALPLQSPDTLARGAK